MSHHLDTSVWRIADALVVTATDGQWPVLAELPDQVCVVAWTDVDAARAAIEDRHRLVSIELAELFAQLPLGFGVLVDPQAPEPLLLPASTRDAVVQATGPFPPGASVQLSAATGSDAFVDAVRREVATVEGARSVRVLRSRAADARPGLLVVYDLDALPGTDRAVLDAVGRAVGTAVQDEVVRVLSLFDVPDEHRGEVVTTVAPCWP